MRIEPFSIRSWALQADSAIHPPAASCSGSRRSGSNPLWKSLSTEGTVHPRRFGRRSSVLAELDGNKAGLDDALALLHLTLDTPLLDPSIVVVRGGERPVVWELPGPASTDRHARLMIRDTPPAWLDLVVAERSAA